MVVLTLYDFLTPQPSLTALRNIYYLIRRRVRVDETLRPDEILYDRNTMTYYTSRSVAKYQRSEQNFAAIMRVMLEALVARHRPPEEIPWQTLRHSSMRRRPYNSRDLALTLGVSSDIAREIADFDSELYQAIHK